MKRIIILRPDNIGDFVMFGGVLECYAELFHGYAIDLICNRAVMPLAKNSPFIENVFSYSDQVWSRKCFLQRWAFFRNLRKYHYEKAIYPVYSRSMDSERLMDHIHAKEKIVFDGDFGCDVSGQRFSRNSRYSTIIAGTDVECNEVERNFEFVRKLGYRGDAIEVNSRVWLSESDRRRAAEILNKYGLKKKEFVLLCPGARQLQRLWPVTKWRELVRFLLTSTSRKVVFCGDVCDRLIIDDIVEPFDHESRIINLAGLLSLNEFAGIINNAELLIGVDSGPIHIAAALKIPNICIAGGGHGRRFYPYGDLRMNRIVYKQLDCFGCNWHCKYNKAKCIDMNTVTDVVREISFLREHQGFAF